MSDTTLNRRGFLKSTSVAVGAVAVGSSVLMAPDGAWAMTLAKVDARSAKTLMVMARDLFPHASIGDDAYGRVIEKLDQEAAKDDKVAQALAGGVKALDQASGGNYAKAKSAKRVATLKSMEHDAFFQKVRGAMINNFYNDPAVWKKLGYEGPSAELGGYLHRGFNDLNWLPKA
jgi:hypothetical protein